MGGIFQGDMIDVNDPRQLTVYDHLGETEPPPISQPAVEKRGKMDIHFSSASGTWGTPQWLYDALDREFHFVLDAAADKNNHKHQHYLGEGGIMLDALTSDWKRIAANTASDTVHAGRWPSPIGGDAVFLNPPYGRGINLWVEKAASEARRGVTVVCLLPARVDTNWFFETCFGKEIRLVRGRLHFLVSSTDHPEGQRTDPAPFPSMVVVMGPGSQAGAIRVLDARGKK